MVFSSKPSNWINIFKVLLPLRVERSKCELKRENDDKKTTEHVPCTQSMKIWFWTTSRIRRRKINENERTNEKRFKCSRRGDHLRINSFLFCVDSDVGQLVSLRSRSIHCVHGDWNQMDIIFRFVWILHWFVCVPAIIIELNAHWSVISPINKEFKREFNR